MSDATRDRTAAFLRWTGLLGILTVAIIRVMTGFASQVLFDVDPALDPTPLAVLGPGGSLWLDVLLLMVCAGALVGESLARRGFDGLLLTLALAPWVIVLWHGRTDAGDLWRGATWASAALAGVTLAHLCRDPRFRLVAMTLLLAAAAPLLIRGAMQVTIEHTDLIEAFESNRGRFLSERGWTEDSPAAAIYERRLRQPQPRGWFLSTNVFASVMVVGLVSWLGLMVGAVRRSLPGGWAGAAGLIALMCAVAVFLTGSKGAIGLAFAGVTILAALLAPWRLASRLRAHVGVISMLMVAAVLGVVVIRGAILSEDFAGDRSLLFRWHYLVGAGRMLPDWFPVGVGADGFQAAYALHRLPRSPEEVISAHSVFTDWVCTLGVAGVFWIAMVLLMVGRSKPDATEVTVPDVVGPDVVGPDVDAAAAGKVVARAAMLVGLLAFSVAFAVEWHTLDPLDLLVRCIGVFGFFVFATLAGGLLIRGEPSIVMPTLATAALVLLMHAQIEMTLFQPGAVVWGFAVIGLAGRTRGRSGERHRGWPGLTAAVVAVAVAGGIVVTAGIPAVRQELAVRSAAFALFPPSDDLDTMLHQRATAITRLEEADRAWPSNTQPLHFATRQAILAAGTDPSRRRDFLLRAGGLANRAVARDGSLVALSLRAAVYHELARAGLSGDAWGIAISDATRIAELDPQAPASWKRLGDILWDSLRRDEAVDAYERALENDDNFELDPLKQMSPRERQRLEGRIGERGA